MQCFGSLCCIDSVFYALPYDIFWADLKDGEHDQTQFDRFVLCRRLTADMDLIDSSRGLFVLDTRFSEGLPGHLSND